MASIKTSISLEEDLHWKFQEEIPKRRMQSKDAISQAIELWLAAGPAAAALPRLLNDAEHPDFRDLIQVLGGPETTESRAVMSAVEVAMNAYRKRTTKTETASSGEEHRRQKHG